MTDNDDLDRFVSEVSAERLSAALGINFEAHVQRWEIQRANGARTEEFLDYYDRCQQLSDDDKFALMGLIVASFDDWSWHAPAGHPLAGRLRQRLVRDFRTHAATIYYWCQWEETGSDPDHIFKITLFMREIWCSQRPKPQLVPE